MKYLTWKQIRARLEILWDVHLAEESWAQLKLAFLKAVIDERDHSRQFAQRESHDPYPRYMKEFGSKKPNLDYYDNRVDMGGQYKGRWVIWRK
jgi:hypothetical protein